MGEPAKAGVCGGRRKPRQACSSRAPVRDRGVPPETLPPLAHSQRHHPLCRAAPGPMASRHIETRRNPRPSAAPSPTSAMNAHRGSPMTLGDGRPRSANCGPSPRRAGAGRFGGSTLRCLSRSTYERAEGARKRSSPEARTGDLVVSSRASKLSAKKIQFGMQVRPL
jgi:hypothetical protein